MPLTQRLSDFVETRYARLLARCREAGVLLHDDAGVAEHLQRVLLASDFAFDSLVREPELLAADGLALMADPRLSDVRMPELGATEHTAMQALRRFRRREALRLIWRDVNALDDVEGTLAGATALAESCLAAALAFAEGAMTRKHGAPRNDAGEMQRLVVLGLGKLGGGELNFSSDIDLILAYSENGSSDGGASLANESWFARLGQLLVKLLGEISVDGYVFRVDLRLRPFGSAGRVALSFAAMEQYYQREGRDWERYAWIKARPVAGDVAAGNRLLETLRPFVYRRYHDYTAFAGLREMKALIDAEVARKDLSRNLKLGPGGIREIEFVVQLLQLIRGGREPSLRERGLLPALAACERIGALPSARAQRLREAYLFLRRVENRVQMLRDEQTHELPEDEESCTRLARVLGYADSAALEADVARVRTQVAEEFAAVMAPVRAPAGASATDAGGAYWRRLRAEQASAEDLALLGFSAVEKLHAQADALQASPAARALSERSRTRFDHLLPRLIDAAAQSHGPDACLERILRLIQAVLRRPAYLALLEEQPAARNRVVAIFADSALLAEHVIAHPLLLDDLFDAAAETVPSRAILSAEIERRAAQLDGDDVEGEIEILQEEKQSAVFRIGLAYSGGDAAVTTARALTDAAEVVLEYALRLALRDVERQHGVIAGGSAFAIVGYGSLGGAELGFASDLDLVFVYDGAHGQCESDGERPLEGTRYYARVAQRVVHWLTTQTQAGHLYHVDIRLRPDGGKGLLVVSLDAFAEYQRERAWIWETQALVRARPIGGADTLRRRFAETRASLLELPRNVDDVRKQITAMRARWRAERDRSNPRELDLKQGAGALLDIEFILQALVLLRARNHRDLLASSNSAELIVLCGRCGVIDTTQAQALGAAHAALLKRSLDCTLDARPRLVVRDSELEQHAAAVLAVAASIGLEFG